MLTLPNVQHAYYATHGGTWSGIKWIEFQNAYDFNRTWYMLSHAHHQTKYAVMLTGKQTKSNNVSLLIAENDKNEHKYDKTSQQSTERKQTTTDNIRPSSLYIYARDTTQSLGITRGENQGHIIGYRSHNPHTMPKCHPRTS